jgi:hypothetical protein
MPLERICSRTPNNEAAGPRGQEQPIFEYEAGLVYWTLGLHDEALGGIFIGASQRLRDLGSWRNLPRAGTVVDRVKCHWQI